MYSSALMQTGAIQRAERIYVGPQGVDGTREHGDNINGYEQDHDSLGSCWRSSSRSIGDRHCLRRVGVGPEHPHLQPSGCGIALAGAILAFFRRKPTSSVGLVASRQALRFFFSGPFSCMACCGVLVTALANDGSKEPVGLIPSRGSGDRIRLGSLLRPQQQRLTPSSSRSGRTAISLCRAVCGA